MMPEDMVRGLNETPRQPQVIRCSHEGLAGFENWAIEGTGLAVAARVEDPEGHIALVKNGWSDGWTLPGGGVESGEEPAAAAVREVREETGLEATVAEPLVLLEQSYVYKGDVAADIDPDALDEDDVRYRGACIVFAATAEGELPPGSELGIEGETIRAARWFADIPQDLHDGDVLRPYLQRPRSTSSHGRERQ